MSKCYVCLDHAYDGLMQGWCFLIRPAYACEL
jgi:hypothetical protein